MRILHLSKFYRPDPGGLEYIVAQLAEGESRAGHEVRVIAATGSSWARDPGKRITEPPRGNVVVVRLPTYGIVWSQPVAPGYIPAARWPADVVHLHHPHPLADLAALVGPRRPLVITQHSDIRRQALARPLYGPLVRGALKRAQAVVVPTEAHVRASRELQGFQSKVRIVPFGVDLARFTPGPGAPRPRIFPDHRPTGLFVGRLVAYKGLDVLIEAVRGTEMAVVIVGGGPERARLERMVEHYGLAGQVLFAGEVEDAALPEYYQAADWFVLPSTTNAEMFGVVLLEAMAMERPVISTALPTGVREVTVAGKTGLEVAPRDVTGLREAMDRLSSDVDLRRRMGAAGRKRVLERFTLEKMLSGYGEVYREVSGKS